MSDSKLKLVLPALRSLRDESQKRDIRKRKTHPQNRPDRVNSEIPLSPIYHCQGLKLGGFLWVSAGLPHLKIWESVTKDGSPNETMVLLSYM